MGLISAALNSASGVLADQWLEYFYCESIPNDVLVVKGQKRTSGRSSNYKGSDNIISNGSVIAVADGQCMLIVEQGRIVDLCAEPGEYKYDMSTEPSLFDGGRLGDNIKAVFANVGKRFTFGGEAPKDQRVYYFNTKEIMGNKYGTPSTVPFRVVDQRAGIDIDVNIRCFGEYSYRITNPMTFYVNVCGNVASDYKRTQIDAQMKSELLTNLQEAFAAISEQGIRYSSLPGHAKELTNALRETLEEDWKEGRGIELVKAGVSSVKAEEEDEKMLKEMQKTAAYTNKDLRDAYLAAQSGQAMVTAAGNTAGAMTGFMGMGMATNMGSNMGQAFGVGQQQYQQAPAQQAAPVQQQAPAQQAAPAQAAPAADSWTCPSCGQSVTGKFCPECGTKKPEPKPAANSWICPSCGKIAIGKFCPECGTKKPEAAAPEGWTCPSCGTVNKGKFCANCGTKKPAAAPLYKCDKCGWEPEDPMNPPKFCPECGDPFGDEDITNK